MARPSAGVLSALRSTALSAPIDSALRSCSPAASGPREITVTSPPGFFSLSCSAASTAHRSKSLTSYLSPVSSTLAPSLPIANFTSITGTRLMHTAIFTAGPP